MVQGPLPSAGSSSPNSDLTAGSKQAGGVFAGLKKVCKVSPKIHINIGQIKARYGKSSAPGIRKRIIQAVQPRKNHKTKAGSKTPLAASSSAPAPSSSKSKKLIVRAKAELTPVKDTETAKQILARHIQTPEDLNVLCQKLPDTTFKQLKPALYSHLRQLEAQFHVGNMLKDCTDKDGRLDTAMVAKSLSQHRKFIARSSANVYFTDEVNYVKARMGMVNSPQLEILKKVRGCEASDLGLHSLEIMQSGAGASLKQAEQEGGVKLRQARDEATAKVDSYLDRHSPGKKDHIRFMAMASSDTCRKMEKMLIDKLSPADHAALKRELGAIKAKTFVDDLTRKAKSLEILAGRTNGLRKDCFAGGFPVKDKLKALLGAKDIHSDALLLGKVDQDGARLSKLQLARAEKEILVVSANEVARILTNRVIEMAEESQHVEAARDIYAFIEQLQRYAGELQSSPPQA